MRWLAPAAVLGLAAATATGVFASGSDSRHLPPVSPAALIAALRSSPVTGYSGTVVSRMSFGLPELPDVGGQDVASFASLLTGSHTLQVWYGGAEEQRIAVLGATDETDLFRFGRTVWLWDSADRVATHTVLPERGLGFSDLITGVAAPHQGNPSVLTPSSLARRALAAIRPSTRVQVRRGAPVADRSTYQLVLTPRSTSTLVGSVRISIDGLTKVPLGVQVYPRGSSSPAIDVAYTSITYGRPTSTSFQFAPPSGATVRQIGMHAPAGHNGHQQVEADGTPRVITGGSDWTSVACYRFPRAAKLPALRGPLAHAFQPVSGYWGRGRLLQANLVSVLFTRDGWACAGAVPPSVLYATADTR
jgi:hypothetical protein